MRAEPLARKFGRAGPLASLSSVVMLIADRLRARLTKVPKTRVVCVSVGLTAAAIVLVWWLGLPGASACIRMVVTGQKFDAGKQTVFFRVGSTDGRRVRLNTMFVSRGPESGSSSWRLPQFTSGSPEGDFLGQKEFGVVGPPDWRVWRLRANASMERDMVQKTKLKWLVFRQYHGKSGIQITGMPSNNNLIGAANFLLGTNLTFYTTNQVLESEPITNSTAH